MKCKRIIVTGRAGFIGSALVRMILKATSHEVLIIDKLTYAGHLDSLESIANSGRYQFEKVDICNTEAITQIFTEFQPETIFTWRLNLMWIAPLTAQLNSLRQT